MAAPALTDQRRLQSRQSATATTPSQGNTAAKQTSGVRTHHPAATKHHQSSREVLNAVTVAVATTSSRHRLPTSQSASRNRLRHHHRVASAEISFRIPLRDTKLLQRVVRERRGGVRSRAERITSNRVRFLFITSTHLQRISKGHATQQRLHHGLWKNCRPRRLTRLSLVARMRRMRKNMNPNQFVKSRQCSTSHQSQLVHSARRTGRSNFSRSLHRLFRTTSHRRVQAGALLPASRRFRNSRELSRRPRSPSRSARPSSRRKRRIRTATVDGRHSVRHLSHSQSPDC